MNSASLREVFRVEAGEHIGSLKRALGKIEGDPADAGGLRQMILSAHTIKGGAALVGLAQIQEVAQAVEATLTSLQDQRRNPDSSTVELLAEAIRVLRQLVDGGPAAEPEASPLSGTELVRKLREHLSTPPGGPDQPGLRRGGAEQPRSVR